MENLQLKSVVTPEGNLELFLESSTVPECSEDEVIIEVQAAPINPSDVLMIFGAADISTAKVVGTSIDPRIRVKIPDAMKKVSAAKERLGHPLSRILTQLKRDDFFTEYGSNLQDNSYPAHVSPTSS